MCPHEPPCASASAPDRGAARVVAARPEQGWSLLCNRVILFDDGGLLLPSGESIAPRAAQPGRTPAAA
ncbi:MAG: DUF5999 family protein [Actinomycetes bacterium]